MEVVDTYGQPIGLLVVGALISSIVRSLWLRFYTTSVSPTLDRFSTARKERRHQTEVLESIARAWPAIVERMESIEEAQAEEDHLHARILSRLDDVQEEVRSCLRANPEES